MTGAGRARLPRRVCPTAGAPRRSRRSPRAVVDRGGDGPFGWLGLASGTFAAVPRARDPAVVCVPGRRSGPLRRGDSACGDGGGDRNGAVPRASGARCACSPPSRSRPSPRRSSPSRSSARPSTSTATRTSTSATSSTSCRSCSSASRSGSPRACRGRARYVVARRRRGFLLVVGSPRSRDSSTTRSSNRVALMPWLGVPGRPSALLRCHGRLLLPSCAVSYGCVRLVTQPRLVVVAGGRSS